MRINEVAYEKLKTPLKVDVKLKWNARVLRTGSDQNVPAHWSAPLMLSSPALVGQRREIEKFVARARPGYGRENVRARLGPFHLSWSEPGEIKNNLSFTKH